MKKIVCCGVLAGDEPVLENLRREGFELAFPLGPHGIPRSAEDTEKVLDALAGAEGFISGGMHVDDAVLDRAPGLKAVVFCGVGYASFIDASACRRHKVALGFCPGANARAVAEFSSALLTSALKDLAWFNKQVKDGIWLSRSTPDIFDQVLGFIGFGNVGVRLARIMRRGYGCRVLYHARSAKEDAERELDAQRRDLEGLLAESSVVIVSVTWSEETTGLINRERISRMRDGALLLNLSRSEIVDTPAVLEALETGKLSKYITDVFHPDSITAEEALAWKGKYPDDKRCIVTPHTSWASPNTARETSIMAVETMRKLLNGEDVPNQVRFT
ncbi:MAG: hypothetical protein LBQ35_04795 [Spirochaetaceae bacterium]|jgi:phosphoglycerate dehydrogenase-like enzyme|nr:hypothetical protein [Spirochaetaceae bacterium]